MKGLIFIAILVIFYDALINRIFMITSTRETSTSSVS